ncbi:MAG: hypothetical protein AB7N91_32840 [Candidatus Tectimicrobiota bacterium]
MAEREHKQGFANIRAEAASLAVDPHAQQFVNAAQSPPSGPPNPVPPPVDRRKGERMLVVEGHLKNRRTSCQPPMQLYLRNELAAWMQRHASAGRGGNQILINYLLQRGIQAVEHDYRTQGILFVDADQDTLQS